MMCRRHFLRGTLAAPFFATAVPTDPLAAAATEYCDLMRAAGARLYVFPDGAGR